jgi:hypothetical protein
MIRQTPEGWMTRIEVQRMRDKARDSVYRHRLCLPIVRSVEVVAISGDKDRLWCEYEVRWATRDDHKARFGLWVWNDPYWIPDADEGKWLSAGGDLKDSVGPLCWHEIFQAIIEYANGFSDLQELAQQAAKIKGVLR